METQISAFKGIPKYYIYTSLGTMDAKAFQDSTARVQSWFGEITAYTGRCHYIDGWDGGINDSGIIILFQI